jgi:hypothetical protein
LGLESSSLIGFVLVAGLGLFLLGAAAWRLEYQRPLPESLPVVHQDRRRRAWIHTWMIATMFATPAGLAGLAASQEEPTATALAAMAAAVFTSGAVCLIVSLVFALTVVPWAAQRTVEVGEVPAGFAAYNRFAATLYIVHMLSAYVASALLGFAVLAADALPVWLGWAGVGWGLVLAAGLVVTRFAGPFNPPILAHVYPGVVGAVLLLR